jgi:hypothetical protein
MEDEYSRGKPSNVLPGQVYGWCVSKASDYEGWGFLYWEIKEKMRVIQRDATVKVRMYFAGFCSMGRGRHWDRRSRYGEK